MSLYIFIKILHILAVISWMAGMFYLPRLYVYHTENATKPEVTAVFRIMEQRLLRIIINPALIITLITGFFLIHLGGALWTDGWLHGKLALVVLMLITHAFYARWRQQLARNIYHHSSKFYRIMNEVPTILLIGIVVLVVWRPF